MKIEGTGKVGGSGEIPGKKRGKVSDASFESHLKDAFTGKKGKPASVPSFMPVSNVQHTGEVGKAITSKAEKLLESMLGDLELYRNSLANTDIPKSRLQPMNDSLMEKKGNLVKLLKMVDDPELKELIAEAASLVVNENSRYYSY